MWADDRHGDNFYCTCVKKSGNTDYFACDQSYLCVTKHSFIEGILKT
jgi:hypothetical protein